MNIIQKLAPFKAFRYPAFVVAFLLWLVPTTLDIVAAIGREWRANWADFTLKVEDVERTWARRKLAAKVTPAFAKQKPLPGNKSDTIKFRRSNPFDKPGATQKPDRWTAETIAAAAAMPLMFGQP